MKVIPETHDTGYLSIENLDIIQAIEDKTNVNVGLQTAVDGRIWLCVNGIAFIRFKPRKAPLTLSGNSLKSFYNDDSIPHPNWRP